jgi:hypothetical protein
VTAAKTAAPPEREEQRIDDDFEPVLELDTVKPRRSTVRIKTADDREGTLFELLNPDELGLEDEHVLREELREFSQLLGKQGKLTTAEKKRMEARLDEICRKVLLAPEAIQKKLTPRKKQKVITNFTGALFAEDAAAIDGAMMARLGPQIMGS